MLEGDVAQYVNQKLQHLPEQPLGGCRVAEEWTSFGPKSCDPITIKLEEAQLLRAPGEARHMEGTIRLQTVLCVSTEETELLHLNSWLFPC